MIDGMQQNLGGKWVPGPISLRTDTDNPLLLDSVRPVLRLEDYAYNEIIALSLLRCYLEEAPPYHSSRQVIIRWALYEEMAHAMHTSLLLYVM